MVGMSGSNRVSSSIKNTNRYNVSHPLTLYNITPPHPDHKDRFKYVISVHTATEWMIIIKCDKIKKNEMLSHHLTQWDEGLCMINKALTRKALRRSLIFNRNFYFCFKIPIPCLWHEAYGTNVPIVIYHSNKYTNLLSIPLSIHIYYGFYIFLLVLHLNM